MSIAFFATFALVARSSSTSSAPNISGTSVSSTVPPAAAIRLAILPTSGFAVMPDSPSLPPHFIPRISSFAGIGSRFALPA